MKTLVLLYTLLVTLCAEPAWSSTSVPKESVSKKLKTRSLSKKKKGSRQALSQGYSASEALMMGRSHWNFNVDQSFERGFDEFADTYFSNTSFSASYRLNTWSALSVSQSYNTIALAEDGEPFQNYSSDPDQFGWGDLRLGYAIPGFWRKGASSLTYSVSLGLPTSTTSQRATLNASLSNSIVYRYRLMRGWLLTARGGVVLNSHKKDDSDVSGVGVNSPFGLSTVVGTSYQFLKNFFAGLNYSQYRRLDYDNNWTTIQGVSAVVNFNVTAQAGIYAGYSYRDRLVTNEELFDDDRSSAFLGVSYAFQ